MGVTLSHPHGQIYALPHVPPIAQTELRASRRHAGETGRCLHCDEIEGEAAGQRCLFGEAGMLAFVPRAARWPYEVHLYPRRHLASLADLDDGERWALADVLLRVSGNYDRHFGFYPPHRRSDRLKQLAGVEIGAGTFVNDTQPEATAAELREADQQSRI